jgi:hypothetical protein
MPPDEMVEIELAEIGLDNQRLHLLEELGFSVSISTASRETLSHCPRNASSDALPLVQGSRPGRGQEPTPTILRGETR